MLTKAPRLQLLRALGTTMAKTEKKAAHPHRSTHASRKPAKPAPEVVEAAWLLKAGALVLALGLLCAYITLCGLFMHGQWQLVLHPSRTSAHTPSDLSLKAEELRFGPANALHGWWIPTASPADPTVLLLPSGNGSAADWLARAETLHEAHLNVLLFDYRGYGASSGQHPTETSMEQDSEAALAYLTGSRSVPPASVLLFGAGAGASLAVRLCAEHPELPALILESADGDFAPRAGADPRAKLVPFTWLFDQDFPLAAPLATLKTPKLLISYTTGAAPLAMQRAADPKMLLELPTPTDTPDLLNGLRRVVDAWITRQPGQLTPNT